MPEMTGADFLARAKNVVPTARRVLLISWADRPAAEPVLQAAALAGIELFLPKPAWSPDEQFHRAVIIATGVSYRRLDESTAHVQFPENHPYRRHCASHRASSDYTPWHEATQLHILCRFLPGAWVRA
jgi:response regulator RpfG family c-di-GMP phosphodiesterase